LKKEVNVINPQILLVPPYLYETAKEILARKPIRYIGNYELLEYKKKRYWQRQKFIGDYLPSYFANPLRVQGFYRDFYYSTKAMKKRGYPDMMYWKELPGQIKKYYKRGLG